MQLRVLATVLLALPAAAVEIEWVVVDAPGNVCDTQPQGCFGAVEHTYWISKYEVTNAQYAEFLNAVASDDLVGLYNGQMSSTGGITSSDSGGGTTYQTVPGRGSMPVGSV